SATFIHATFPQMGKEKAPRMREHSGAVTDLQESICKILQQACSPFALLAAVNFARPDHPSTAVANVAMQPAFWGPRILAPHVGAACFLMPVSFRGGQRAASAGHWFTAHPPSTSGVVDAPSAWKQRLRRCETSTTLSALSPASTTQLFGAGGSVRKTGTGPIGAVQTGSTRRPGWKFMNAMAGSVTSASLRLTGRGVRTDLWHRH